MKKIGWKLFWWDCNYLTQRIINSTFSVCSWCCEEHIFPCLWIQMRLNASTPTNTHSRLCLNHKIQSTIVNQHRSNRIAPRFGSLTVRESAPNPPRLPNRAKMHRSFSTTDRWIHSSGQQQNTNQMGSPTNRFEIRHETGTNQPQNKYMST